MKNILLTNSSLRSSQKLKEEERALKAVGVLTSLDRSRWAHVRENLISHSAHNKAALEIIDSALFVLVLDDYIPKDIHEAAANFLHGSYELRTDDGDEIDYQAGTCINRWYDKLQLIVCTDGSAGVNFEHSAIDGHTALRFVSDIFADTVVTFAQSITKTIYSKDHVPSHLNAKVSFLSLLHTNVISYYVLTQQYNIYIYIYIVLSHTR